MDCELVVGGGVIGLLSAYELIAAGRRVTLIEAAEQVGREASWAGGGIVSPLYPWRYSPAVTALAHWSQDFYPAFAERLRVDSGVDPEIHATGLYWLDLDDEDQALAWAALEGRNLVSSPLSEVYRHLPALGRHFNRAVHLPGVANIRNPRLIQALRAALLKMPGFRLLEGVAVDGLLREDGRVVGVCAGGESFRGSSVVLATGAWSADLLKEQGLQLPVEPVKGQMILYKCAPDFLPAMVLAGRRYAIPRRDGHILVGSTLEHVGFDKTPTSNALESLRRTAEQLLPALAEAPVVGHWAGLRPGSPEGVPFIGEVPGSEGLWLNCGHYRNGLVMAPASCRLLVDLMLGRAPIVDPTPYSPAGRLG